MPWLLAGCSSDGLEEGVEAAGREGGRKGYLPEQLPSIKAGFLPAAWLELPQSEMQPSRLTT